MVSRTYGWVQNPSDFNKLKLVVQIFDPNSRHYKNLKDNIIKKYILFDDIRATLLHKLNNNCTTFTYRELVGTSKNKDGEVAKNRTEAVADALIQVTIIPQSSQTSGKMWTDNWTADGYLRWALSLNFLKHDRETDTCTITELGKRFSNTEMDSDEEKDIIRQALLCYPPATQVLNVLNNAKKSVTKFYIGNQLGFIGEKGFTSYDESLIINWFLNGSVEEQDNIKSNIEGTSDKYARMICSWLEKVDYVSKHRVYVDTINGNKIGFPEYSITARGVHALNQANGSSKNKKIKKYFTWEFLAVACHNRDYVRSRRAYILQFIKKTKSFSKLIEQLRELGFNDEVEIIENDIQGLNNFGIRIEKEGTSIYLKDDFYDFTIPNLNLTEELKDKETELLKAKFLRNTQLPMKYIDLLEIAYDSQRNRDFEIITADLFKNVYGIESIHLGGGRKPDCIVYTQNFGIIIDTQAYKNGYSKAISQEDEMVRYIEDNQLRDKNRNSIEWWKHFDSKIPKKSFYFLWISGKFVGQFEEQLISTSNRTHSFGGALNVEQLLIGAHKVQSGNLSINQIPKYFKNKEIFW